VGALERAFAEEDAVVRDDADGVAHYPGEAADQRRAVARLELVEAGAIDEACDDLADVERVLEVRGDDVELVGSCTGSSGGRSPRVCLRPECFR
jgi:hypothetical protein